MRLSSYANRGGAGYGAHCMCVQLGALTIWFSYQTPVAFDVPARRRVVRENSWGPTTGKHLNAIDGGAKRDRVSGEEFERLFRAHVQPTLDLLADPDAAGDFQAWRGLIAAGAAVAS